MSFQRPIRKAPALVRESGLTYTLIQLIATTATWTATHSEIIALSPQSVKGQNLLWPELAR